jgi:ribose transport system substrate-binding protein
MIRIDGLLKYLCVWIIFLLVSGCTGSPLLAVQPQATPIIQAAPSLRKAVGLVLWKKEDGFSMTLQKSASAAAARAGLDLIVDGPLEYQADQQAKIVDKMVSEKVKVLIIAPVDPQKLVESLKRAQAAGIQVITVAGFIGDGNYTSGKISFPVSFIGTDFFLGGQFACQSLIQAMGSKGKIYIQEDLTGDPNAQARQQGCISAIDATNGQVTLAGSDDNHGDQAAAAEQTTAVLQKHPNLTGIFSGNLAGARGASDVVKPGSGDRVKIAVFDASDDAVQDLRDQKIDLVIAQTPGEMAKDAIDTAAKIIHGDAQEIQKRVKTSFVAIDRENVDSPESQNAMYKLCHCSIQ